MADHASESEEEPVAANVDHEVPIAVDVSDDLTRIIERLELDASELWFYTRVLGGTWTDAHGPDSMLG